MGAGGSGWNWEFKGEVLMLTFHTGAMLGVAGIWNLKEWFVMLTLYPWPQVELLYSWIRGSF